MKEQTPVDRTKIPLNRALGLPTAILLVAGIMIGSGAFKKIVPMSQTGLGEGQILTAWIVAGVITMIGAFTYSGLASLTTQSGGVYEYLRLVYGNFIAFLFGWMMFMIGGSGAIAALAFVFSQSVNTLIHLPDPFHSLKDVSMGGFLFPFADSGIKIFAVITICILTWVNYRGVKQGGVLNNIVTTAKILGILLLILAGFFHSSKGDPAPSTSVASIDSSTAVISALFGAMLSALWAYDGWANITYVTGEIKNPQKNLPIAIVAGVGIAMTLYVLVNFSYMQVLPLPALASLGNNQIAAAEVAGVIFGKSGTVVIALLIMTSTFGAVNACIIVYPRLYYRMAQEGSFFRKAAYVHPEYRTPYVSFRYSLVWSCILVITGTFDLLTNLIIFTAFMFFGLVAWGLVKLKRKGEITVRVIGYPVTPFIIIVFSIFLVLNTIYRQPVSDSVMGFVLILSGIPFYYYFKNKYKQIA